MKTVFSEVVLVVNHITYTITNEPKAGMGCLHPRSGAAPGCDIGLNGLISWSDCTLELLRGGGGGGKYTRSFSVGTLRVHVS